MAAITESPWSTGRGGWSPWILLIMASSEGWSVATSVSAVPLLSPPLAVRPIRWVYEAGQSGMDTFTTKVTPLKSMPRATPYSSSPPSLSFTFLSLACWLLSTSSSSSSLPAPFPEPSLSASDISSSSSSSSDLSSSSSSSSSDFSSSSKSSDPSSSSSSSSSSEDPDSSPSSSAAADSPLSVAMSKSKIPRLNSCKMLVREARGSSALRAAARMENLLRKSRRR
mmetsp:Transcript_48482/g.66016  ORF Transcript_48482/g.66016 Transcript_48482/m.66016 type:complete len:225 (-) Transcript_48482:907-1581(-)